MEKIRGGYILQPRSFDSSGAAHFPPCTRETWFYLLRTVNHADNGKFKRGSGLFTLEEIQDALSWSVGYRAEKYSKPQLTKALRRLREESMIETTKATRGMFVTVLNYDKYQDPKNYEGNDEGNAKATRRQLEGMHLKQEGRMKNEETTSLPKKPKFVPPSVEEVRTYCLERNNGIDAQYFVDSNSARGWVVGKNQTPMKDWKAAIRTWEGNNFNGNKNGPQKIGGLTF